jgi:hypothetical protein
MKDKLKSVREFLEQKFNVKLKLEQMDVKLAKMKLADGVTVLEFDALEVGKEVFIVSENGNVTMPIGEYELEDGNMLEIYEDGIIGEVASKEDEQSPIEEKEPVAEVPVEASVEAPQVAKKTVETVSKETYFSEMEELKREITELKEQLKLKEEVKEVVLEENPKPITFNPENVNEEKFNIKLSNNKVLTLEDRVRQKLANIKK